MPKYYGVFRSHAGGGPIALGFEAANVPLALDKFLAHCGVVSSHEGDEYDIYHVIEPNKYVPVVQKFKSNKGVGRFDAARALTPLAVDEDVIQSSVFTEKVYVSWRDTV